jgi:hypothetical protein
MSTQAATSPLNPDRQPDWRRFFPDASHRWAMGLRRGDAASFLAPTKSAADVLLERAHWLSADPGAHAAITPAAEPGLAETVAWARRLGVAIDSTLPPWEQLLCLGRNWEADIVWLVADDVGTYRVAGGVVCFPSLWALRDKLGRTLSETHRPVPGLNAALDRQIDTFLDRLNPGEAWLRENAGYSGSAERNQHPDRRPPPLGATVSIDEVWVRLEHQLLLKLPHSQSVLFGIRVEVVPLRQVLECPQAAADLALLLTTISPAAADYKGLATARSTLISLCRQVAESAAPASASAGDTFG